MTVRRLLIVILPALLAAAPPPNWTPPNPRRFPYRTLTDGDADFCDVVVSRDGKLVAAGNHDGGFRLWSLETGDLLRTSGPHDGGGCRCMVFSHDSRELIVTHTIYKKGGRGSEAAIGARTTWYDTATGKARHAVEGRKDALWEFDLSPDGATLLATRHRDEDAITLFDARTGRLVKSIELPRRMTRARFLPDGSVAAVLQATEVWRYDVKTGKGRLLFGPKTWLYSLYSFTIEPGGDLVGVYGGGLVRFDTDTGAVRWTAKSAARHADLAVTKNRGQLLIPEGGQVYVIDAASGRAVRENFIRSMPGGVGTMAVTRDGRFLLVAGRYAIGVRVYDLTGW